MSNDTGDKLQLSDMYPHLSEDEVMEAEQRLQQYLLITLRVHERRHRTRPADTD